MEEAGKNVCVHTESPDQGACVLGRRSQKMDEAGDMKFEQLAEEGEDEQGDERRARQEKSGWKKMKMSEE